MIIQRLNLKRNLFYNRFAYNKQINITAVLVRQNFVKTGIESLTKSLLLKWSTINGKGNWWAFKKQKIYDSIIWWRQKRRDISRFYRTQVRKLRSIHLWSHMICFFPKNRHRLAGCRPWCAECRQSIRSRVTRRPEWCQMRRLRSDNWWQFFLSILNLHRSSTRICRCRWM